jgi:hypothetical protein
MSQLTQSPAKFYVLDSDFAVERMLVGYSELTNLEITTAYDWPDYISFLSKVLRTAQPHDWVVVDFIGSAWEAVQSHFSQQVFHQDMGDYFLEARKKGQKALEGWTDWSVINPMYRQFINPLLYKGRYNVYCTAKSEALSSDKKPTETPDVRQLFLPYGSKPRGQKDLPYVFHTLLITGRDARGTRTLTTVKDRERPELAGQPVTSFTVNYLRDIGGWELA